METKFLVGQKVLIVKGYAKGLIGAIDDVIERTVDQGRNYLVSFYFRKDGCFHFNYYSNSQIQRLDDLGKLLYED